MDGETLGKLANAAGYNNLEIAEAMKLFRFGQMVAEAEREACADVCDAEEARIDKLADKIIADEDDNSLYLSGKGVAAGKCARLIRERSNAELCGVRSTSERT